MFYDVFERLCKVKNVTPNRACVDMGLSRSIAAKWKSTGTNPSAEVLPKIANYFNVSVDMLLSKMELDLTLTKAALEMQQNEKNPPAVSSEGLTDEEKRFLEKFRAASEDKRLAAEYVLGLK